MNAPSSPPQLVAPNPSAQGVRSQGIALTQLTDPRARYIASLHRSLPRTPEGHLGAIIRADLVPADVNTSSSSGAPNLQSRPQLPEESYIPLSFEEGFPALPDGRPTWFKMEHEPAHLFDAFQVYVDLGDAGPRYISSLLDSVELQRLMGPELNIENLRNAYYMYFWKDRAIAHDIFQNAAYRHIRMRRALSTDDKAYRLATRMLEKLEVIFDSTDFWDLIKHDPSTALSYLEKLVKIQRISAGLPGAAPQEDNSASETSFEMILRNVQQGVFGASGSGDGDGKSLHGASVSGRGSIIDESGRLIPADSEFMRGALHDPHTAKMMQEVIIRMARSRGATKQPRWAGKADPNDADTDPNGGSGEGDSAPPNPVDIPSEFRHLADPSASA